MTEMPKCPYCGETLTVEPDSGLFAMNCDNGECYGNIDVWYSTPEEAIAAASKRYADTARLAEVTRQAVEAVQNIVENSSGFIVDEVNFDFVSVFTRILNSAPVADERDAVELAILVMAAICEAYEPGGAK